MTYRPSRPEYHTHRFRNTTRRQVLDRDGRRCQACGSPGTDGNGAGLALHHIVARRHGGPDTPDNLVTLCAVCHGRIHGGAHPQ